MADEGAASRSVDGSPSAHSAASEVASAATLEDDLAWLQAFEARRGRPLRVLHVGNIANNAYLNAKFLRSVGVEADVLSHDYQHVMATPEWEDVELLHGHGDDYLPSFSKRDLRDYRRPRWFVGGPLRICALQVYRLRGERARSAQLATLLVLERLVAWITRLLRLGPRESGGLYLLLTSPRLFLKKLWRYMWSRAATGERDPEPDSRGGEGPVPEERAQSSDSNDAIADAELVDRFAEAFPQRPDRLQLDDIAAYRPLVGILRAIFDHYDIVQCYATEPIYALLGGKRPYVTFEHGTLRDFTMGDDPLHRLTALAYREADHGFITNGDCLAYAERLGIESYSPIVHPVDVEQHRQDFGESIAALRREIGGDVILFCPVRHDWDVKGPDVHLRALPLIKARLSARVKLVLIRWGMQLADSEALVESLGCGDDVVWRRSMCRIAMIKHMRAANVVLDQMVLPCFGATAPQAFAAGRPVVGSYVPESTAWMIPEPAPILSAFSPEEVADAVVRALDPDWRADFERRARHWIDRYHHPRNVIGDHLNVYRRVLGHDRRCDRAQTPL